MSTLLLESLVSWWSSASGLALKQSVCWWNGLSDTILTIAVTTHRSTILDEHKLGERRDYFIRGYAAVSNYSIVCWFVGNARRHLVVELCLSDGTHTWVKWSAFDGCCYDSMGLVLRLMKPVVALEGYGGRVGLYSGAQMVGTFDVSNDIGAVEISEYTVVSGKYLEVADFPLAVSELMVALLVASLLAVLVWLSDECVLMVCWSCWDWMICLLVLCIVVFDGEDGVMKDHQTHHHQKHHHKHCYACLSPAPTPWCILCLYTRQFFNYFRAYSCFQLNGSTDVFNAYPCFQLNGSTEASNAYNGSTEVSYDYSCFQPDGSAEVSSTYLLGLYLQIHSLLGCLRGECVPRLPQIGLSEGAKTVATVAATLVKQRAVLVKFLALGSCGSNNLQETSGWDPIGAICICILYFTR